MSSSRKQDVEDASRNLPALLDRANHGHTVVTTERGKPFAGIVPVDRAAQKNPELSLSKLRGTGKGLWGRSAAAWLERLRKKW